MNTPTQPAPETLTPQQIKNWRNVLASMFGPVAFVMPDEDIQAFRDQMQQNLGKNP